MHANCWKEFVWAGWKVCCIFCMGFCGEPWDDMHEVFLRWSFVECLEELDVGDFDELSAMSKRFV
jgi:hypothetical protein